MIVRAGVFQIAACGGAILLRLVSTPTANLSYLVIAAYALLGRVQAIQALALLWFFGMVSPGLAAKATAGSVGRYAVLAAAAISVCLRSGVILRTVRISRPVLGTLLLGTFLVTHSVMISPYKDVSILKALSWTVATTTLLAGWSGLSAFDRALLARQIFGALILLAIFSLPLLALPIGYLRNSSGFQGILNHPQAFGLSMGLLGAWAGSRMLSSTRPPWRVLALFGMCLVLVVLSEARTAGIAMLLGILLGAIIGMILTSRSLREFLPGARSRRVHLVVVVSVMVAVVGGAALSSRVDRYLTKRSGTANLAEAYDASRGFVIERMWANIQERPLVGIGFGIASVPEDMVVDRDPLLGLPTGAAIEKGVLPFAIIEELGVFGFLAVASWLWMLVRRASRGGGMTALAVFTTALLLNMGESVLFSPGGFGLLPLILIAWATTERLEGRTGNPYA